MGQAFADDSFMFLKAEPSSVDSAMAAWEAIFGLVSGLHIKARKSVLELYRGWGGKGLWYIGAESSDPWDIRLELMSTPGSFGLDIHRISSYIASYKVGHYVSTLR